MQPKSPAGLYGAGQLALVRRDIYGYEPSTAVLPASTLSDRGTAAGEEERGRTRILSLSIAN